MITNDKPISISFRNNILDVCNDQYENQFSKAPIPSASPMRQGAGYAYDQSKSTPNTRKVGVPSLSPYRQQETHSISPSQFNHGQNNEEEFEATIQGNIDGQMVESQIQNKKAFVWAFGKNQEGELALGVYKDALLPRFVTGVRGHSAKCISSSNHHSALVTPEGLLLVSGSSLHGKLGLDGVNKTNINKFQVV